MIATLEIDLAAIRANVSRLRRLAAPARFAAVVKANAYGHGLVEVSRAIEDDGRPALRLPRRGGAGAARGPDRAANPGPGPGGSRPPRGAPRGGGGDHAVGHRAPTGPLRPRRPLGRRARSRPREDRDRGRAATASTRRRLRRRWPACWPTPTSRWRASSPISRRPKSWSPPITERAARAVSWPRSHP